MSILVGILAIGLGAIVTFMGYRMFRVILPIWGLFVGSTIGWLGTVAVLGDGFFATLIAIVIAVVTGIVFAILSWFFYSVAIVILGASLGYALFVLILNSLGIDSTITNVFVGLIGAIIFGAVTFALDIRKYYIIALTAAAGASIMIVGLLVFFGRVPTDAVLYARIVRPIVADGFLWWVIWFGVTLLGITEQTVTRGQVWFEEYSYDTAVKTAK